MLNTINPLSPTRSRNNSPTLSVQYNIKQASNENKEKHQVGDYLLIQFQILQANII